MMKEIFIPIVEKHGLEKGGRIMCEVGKTLATVTAWPEDIKEDCLAEVQHILELAKAAAAQPNGAR